MKLLRKKSFTQKIIIAVIFVILFNFSVPVEAKAIGIPWGDLGSKLLKELMNLIVTLGDVVMGLLNKVMLGTTDMTSAILNYDDPNLTEGGFVDPSTAPDGAETIEVEHAFEDSWWGGTSSKLKKYKIPNFMYSPEAIFGNKVAQLDVNFINPHQYAGITQETRADDYTNQMGSDDDKVTERSTTTITSKIGGTIADWYKSLRNIAAAGLLSVLVYIGIRILIGSTAQDKAKYKERLMDWVTALILVFAIHFIMAGILLICEQVTNMLSSGANEFIVHVTNTKKEDEEETETTSAEGTSTEGTGTGDTTTEGGSGDSAPSDGDNGNDISFKTNLMGYVRFMTQVESAIDSAGYSIMYVALVIYTVMFTFTYLKRVLYMAFFTMIAPLVALTYPLDKMGDGKAQAFGLWLKEYTMNAIIQPVHLLLYTVLVTSAISLARDNPLYAIVALAFLTPAEKFVKKMFGLDKASTPSTLGSMAAGGLALSGVGKVAGAFRGRGSNSNSNNKGGNGSSGSDESQLESRGKSVRYNTDPYDALAAAGGVAAYGANNENREQQGQLPLQEQADGPRELTPEEMQERIDANQRYQNEGYGGPNAFGEYYNPDTDEYDPNFNPYTYGLNYNRRAQQQIPNGGQQQEQRAGQQQGNGQIRTVNQEDVVPLEDETIDSRVNRRIREERENAQREGTRENRDLNNYLLNNGGDTERNRNAFWDRRQGQIRREERRAEARRIRERRIEDRKNREPQTKLGKGFAAAKALTGMKIKNSVRSIPETSMKVAKKAATGAVKGAVKTAARVGGAAAGGIVGGALVAGAAVTSGENAGKILAGGISAGAGLGASTSGRAANAVVAKASSEYGEYKAVVQSAMNDPKEVKEKKQAKFDKNFKNNTDNYKYLVSKGMKPKQAKDFLQNRSQQFLDAGIDDIKLMHNAIKYQDKMKTKGIDIDDKTLVATTQIAKNLPSNFQENKGLKKSYAEEMMRKQPRITQRMAYNALDGAESIRFPSN